MGYKSWGVIIEGVLPDSLTEEPAIWCAGTFFGDQYVTVEGVSHRVQGATALDFPQLSEAAIDVLSGGLRTGSAKIRLTASDAVCAALLGQAVSFDPALVLDAALSATATQATFTTAASAGVYYLGEEAIRVGTLDSGTTYNLTRAVGRTVAQAHDAATSLYARPTYWAGRRVQLVVFDLPDVFGTPVTPISATVIWTGFLARAPYTIQSTSTVELDATSAIDFVRNVELNLTPARILPTSLRYDPSLARIRGYVAVLDELPYDRVHKQAQVTGRHRVYEVASDNAAGIFDFSGQTRRADAVLDSAWDAGNEALRTGPLHPLLVVSKRLDDLQLAAGEREVSATYDCDYPYHPLTLAAALLASTDSELAAPGVYDVLHPNWGAALAPFMDLGAWTAAIEATYWLEVDEVVLGTGGAPLRPFDFLTRQLLPAFSFQLGLDALGRLIPVRVGLVGGEAYYNAPTVQPLPEKWDWTPYNASLLDGLRITVGTRPWADGQSVAVNGEGVRERTSRLSRAIAPETAELDWPFFAADEADSVALYHALAQLAWRYDGLPQVSFTLDAAAHTPFLGEIVRLTKPDGLLSSILFTTSGARADDWTAARLVAQVIAIQPVVRDGTYNVRCLLSNFAFGTYAKWRAPAARIKSVPGTGQYLIEGLASDFADVASDALRFTVGDEVALYTEALDVRDNTTSAQITSITASGDDWVIAVSPNFSPVGVAGNWILLADSNLYYNEAVIDAADPYPYVSMTDAATLTRPGSTTTDPDRYS